MVDLRPDQLATVCAVLQTEVPDCEVWAFGSRAKWTARDTSDLDLAIIGKERLAFSRLGRLREAFEESYLPIKVDVVDFRKVSPEFQKIIEEEHVVLQKASSSADAPGKQWRTLPLEECVETIIDYRGKTPRKVSRGIPLITAKVVKGGRIEEPDEFIAPEDYDGWMRRGFPKAGDVLLTMEAPLGEVAQLDDRKVALAQRLVAIRGNAAAMDNTFLRYALQSDIVQDQLRSRATGTTVLGIRQSELRKINVPIPPLDEQRSIAHVLRTLDDKIELNRRMNATLEAMARALFQSWFVDFDPVRAKQENRLSVGLDEPTAALFSDQFQNSELGPIPQGWEVGSILNQASLLSGGTPKTSVADYWDGEIPWASAKDVSQCGEAFLIETERQITSRGLDESATKMIPEFSTAVVARGATTGRLTMFGKRIAMNQTCYALCSKIAAPFSLYCHAREFIDHMVHAAHGSVFDTITTRTFETTQVLLPPVEVQHVFDERVAPLFRAILNNLHQSRTLATLRDTLLPRLLSGEISITS